MLGRRRPLLRAAAVGGVAYHAGKKHQQSQYHTEEQDAQIAEMQAQQAQYPQQQYAAPAPQAAPSEGGGGIADQLAKLKSLLDSGALSQGEYEAAKQSVIRGG